MPFEGQDSWPISTACVSKAIVAGVIGNGAAADFSVRNLNDFDSNPRFFQFFAEFFGKTGVGNQMVAFTKGRYYRFICDGSGD